MKKNETEVGDIIWFDDTFYKVESINPLVLADLNTIE